MGWIWDTLSFSLGATKKLPLLPDWNLICHPRVYKTFLHSQVVDSEQSQEFRNFVRYCNASMCLFDIGASSIKLLAIHQRLECIWPGLVDVTDIFDHPSIAALASFIEGKLATAKQI